MGVLLRVKLNAFSILKNIFSRLNPLDSFRWGKSDEEVVVLLSSKELLEITIKKYSEFEKFILVAIYHLLNTQNKSNEFLTVLTKDFKLIADLVEGLYGEVPVPKNVKSEAKKGNVFLTCHNHYCGAIIPSVEDFENSICRKIPFSIIVSEGNICILINEFNNLDNDTLRLLNVDLNDYIEYVRFSFIINNEYEIQELDKLDLEEDEYNLRYQILFDKYVAKNNLKFVNEFNSRMKKYNLYFLYIIC